MARKKRLLQMTSSSAIASVTEPRDQGRLTRSRSRANAADVHTEPCSLPDIFKPRKKGRGEAAVAASPSPSAKGTEEDGEQSCGPTVEEAGGDDDNGAIVVVDDPSDRVVVVVADDHGDHNVTSNTTCDGNNSNPCGGEDNVGTSLTDSADHSRRKRGPTRALDVLLLPKGEKIKVTNNGLGQAIGNNANKLSSFMGTIARNGCIAPLTYKDWRMMPQIYKDKMWNCILEHYDAHETDEERLADCDERVLPDQWTELVRFWSSEEGTSFGRGEAAPAAVAAPSSPNAKGTEDDIDDEQSHGRGEAAASASPSPNAEGTEEGLDGEQSYGPIKEEARGDDDHGAIVVVDDPSDHDVIVMADDHDDPNDTSNTTSGGNTSNHCGGEDNGTSLTVQPISHASPTEAPSSPSSLQEYSKGLAEFNKLLSELPVESQDRTTKDNIFAQVMGRDQYGRVRTYGLGPVPSDFYGPNPNRAESAARAAMRAAIAEQMIIQC
ncbi:hypothetical protein EJ110_NYTH08102 [Nymphaea thermarum]|nr:hypothetical protein EJ110_NYTH08102 [Nymphaea thermarum]